MAKANTTVLLREDTLRGLIFHMRGVEVILDRDLAQLYQVETRALKQAVKRNITRFPQDFMFTLDDAEIDILVSQSVIPSRKVLGGAAPYVFTKGTDVKPVGAYLRDVPIASGPTAIPRCQQSKIAQDCNAGLTV